MKGKIIKCHRAPKCPAEFRTAAATAALVTAQLKAQGWEIVRGARGGTPATYQCVMCSRFGGVMTPATPDVAFSAISGSDLFGGRS